MNSDKLYKVQEQDLDRLKEILTVCFQNDPLYSTLIEDEATKERLLPHLLECDVTELFETCEVFADSPELKGVRSFLTNPITVMHFIIILSA